MRHLLAVAAIALLSGCAQSAKIASNQAEDLDRFLGQNHDIRYAVRAKAAEVVNFAVNTCLFQATDDTACQAAITRANLVLGFLEENYPELVTVQAVQKGYRTINQLRQERQARNEETASQ